MTTGQGGENISRIALNAEEDSSITTSMPYINYSWIGTLLDSMLQAAKNAIDASYSAGNHTYESIAASLDDTVMRYGRLNYVSTAKLLRSLGMLNTELDSYDMIAITFLMLMRILIMSILEILLLVRMDMILMISFPRLSIRQT